MGAYFRNGFELNTVEPEPGIRRGNEDSHRNENRGKKFFPQKNNWQAYYFFNSPSM